MKTTATLVADGIWRITTPLPFRPRSVHAYLVEDGSDGWLLVDGGANTDDAWSALDSAVREVAGWETVRLHLITHMHLDHVGLVERVRRASVAPLAMGELDAERTEHAHADPAEEAEYRGDLLRRAGAPADLIREVRGGIQKASPYSAFVPTDVTLPGRTAELDAAPGWLSVWTPGHTAGHTSLYRPSDGVLIAGDAVLPRVTPTIGVNRQRPDPVGDYLVALDRLAGLRPSLALCGHGEPILVPEARIAELEAEARAETARVAEILALGPATTWEVVSRRYADRDLPAGPAMLALRETLAHLEHLTAAGAARREPGLNGDALRFAVS